MPLLKALSQIELVSSRDIMLGHMFPFLIAQHSYAMLMDALQIYDVTKYLEDHPGGADVLLREVTGTTTTLLLMSLVRHFLFSLSFFDHI
jgi:hypothetical protein